MITFLVMREMRGLVFTGLPKTWSVDEAFYRLFKDDLSWIPNVEKVSSEEIILRSPDARGHVLSIYRGGKEEMALLVEAVALYTSLDLSAMGVTETATLPADEVTPEITLALEWMRDNQEQLSNYLPYLGLLVAMIAAGRYTAKNQELWNMTSQEIREIVNALLLIRRDHQNADDVMALF